MNTNFTPKKRITFLRIIKIVGVLGLMLGIAVSSAAAATRADQSWLSSLTSNPYIWADPSAEYINGWDWGVGDSITIKLYDQSDHLLFSGEQVARSDSGVGFDMRAEGIDMQAGYRITLSDGLTTKELVVSKLEITFINSEDRTISGIYDPDPNLDFTINVEGQELDNLTFNGDQWTATYLEWLPGTGAEVYQSDEDGDMTGIGFGIPNPWLIAFPENEAVEGWEWTLGVGVHLEIDDPATEASPDFEQDGVMIAPDWGDTRTYVRFDFSEEYNLKIGDIVSIDDGVTTRTHIVRNLSVTGVDLFADTVAGTADPGAIVQVWPHAGSEIAQATAGAAGAWLADIGETGFDIVGGTGGRSQIVDEEGNATAVDWYVPYLVFIPVNMGY